VRLVEKGSRFRRYIALSHCWGDSLICILDRKTILKFKRSIPWTRLPKTFQDAIIFSAKLGVNHIWIDALCIVQDDPDDWERESAKMADIYQNSFLTLAAIASSNGMGGCFSEAISAVSSEHELSGQYLDGLGHIVVRAKLQHWAWPPSKAARKLHPLLSRGWVFQERILSPRFLHFCKDELLWECREEIICECESLPAPPETRKQFYIPRDGTTPRRTYRRNTWRRAFGKIMITMFRRNKTPTKREALQRITAVNISPQEEASHPTNIERREAAENWHRVVEQYSSLSLTKQTDRLAALSGLAIRSSPVLGQYLAGLWEHSLVSDLMWRIDKLEHGIVRPTEYIAPSWSWASVTGQVKFWPESDTRMDEENVHRGRSLFEFESQINAKSTRFTPTVNASRLNPYGMISSGTLYVHGYIQTARCRSTRFNDDTSIEPAPLKYELHGNGVYGLPFFADYVLQAEGPHYVSGGDELHLLFIHPYICLVLKSVKEELKTFRRIGIVRHPVPFSSEYPVFWMNGSLESDIEIV
jgi:hypothetical protein